MADIWEKKIDFVGKFELQSHYNCNRDTDRLVAVIFKFYEFLYLPTYQNQNEGN